MTIKFGLFAIGAALAVAAFAPASRAEAQIFGGFYGYAPLYGYYGYGPGYRYAPGYDYGPAYGYYGYAPYYRYGGRTYGWYRRDRQLRGRNGGV